MTPPLVTHLSQLEQSGLIRLAQIRPEIEYLFRHALIQDAVYDSLLKQDRKKLHLDVAEAIQNLFPDRQLDLAATLAHHYIEAEEPANALYYLGIAANQAASRYAHPEAESLYRAALELVTSDPDRLTLLSQLAEAVLLQSRFTEAATLFREAIDLGKRLNALDVVARCYARLAWGAWQGGNPAQAERYIDEGLTVIDGAPDSEGIARLLQEAARTYAFVAEVHRAREMGQRALDLARRFDLKAVQAEALNTVSIVSWGYDDPERIIAMLRESLALSEAMGAVYASARAHNNLGSGLGDALGRWREARFHFRRGVEMNQQLEFAAGTLFCMANVAAMSLFLGEIRAARKQIRSLNETLRSLTDTSAAHSTIRVINARLMRQEGDLQTAYDEFFNIYHYASANKDSQSMMEALGWLADVAYEIGRLDEVLPFLELIPDEMFYVIFQIMQRCFASIAYAQQGRWDDSGNALADAYTRSKAIPGNWAESWMLLTEARLAVIRRHIDEALGHYETIAVEMAAREMRWHRAHVLIEWAQNTYPRDAIPLLQEAYAEFEAMGAEGYATMVADRLTSLERQND